jgi:hypothetical protein
MPETTPAELFGFPDSLLFDLARNPSAPRTARKQAVKFLIERASPRIHHPDLVGLVTELKSEQSR